MIPTSVLLSPLVAFWASQSAGVGASVPAAAPEAAKPRSAAEIAQAVDAFGHIDEFAAAAQKLLDSRPGKDEKAERFLKVAGESCFTDIALTRWLEWNVAPGKDASSKDALLPAVDFSRPGHPFRAITDLNEQLHAHGTDFLVVIFPLRPSVYPELMVDLPKMDGFAGMVPGTAHFVAELEKAGVDVLFLAEPFVAQRYGKDGDRNDQLFLKNNQHWTPRAAELAASLVAERVKSKPWFEQGKAKEGIDFVVKPIEKPVTIVWGGAPEWAKPETLKMNSVESPDPKRRPLTILPSSPIVLLADSFADYHRQEGADFTTQLWRRLGTSIDLINPRGGVERASRDTLRRRPNGPKDEKIVIWLLPEQVFTCGPQWEPMAMYEK